MRLLLILSTYSTVSLCCQMKDFLPCVMQLSAQKVDFSMNPVEVIFNITTEAKLMHTCRTYSRILPCFDQKMVQCGTSSQKTQLERGKRLHTFLCAPFSLQRQKTFLRRSKCIQEVLSTPQTADCNRNDTVFAVKLNSCRELCTRPDCISKIELSEVTTCTYLNIARKCTSEASQFFAQMQQVLTNKEYPMQCKYDLTRKQENNLKKGLPLESLTTHASSSTTFVTVYPPELPSVIDGVVTQTHSPIMRRTDPNSKSKPRPTTSHSTGPVIKTVFVDERGAPISTTQKPKVVHKFLPNPYTTKNPNTLKNDIIRTTRTIVPADGKQGQTYVPWSYKANSDQPVTLSSELNPPVKPTEAVLSAPPVAFNFKLPADQTSTQPFKIEINWQDDTVKDTTAGHPGQFVSPWYLKTHSYLPPELEYSSSPIPPPLEAMNPLLNQFKSNSLNFTELGNQANNYFSAALNAFAETKKEMAQNDPWRTLIDAVAPTIHKFSPDVIPRIREEINRIQPPQKKN